MQRLTLFSLLLFVVLLLALPFIFGELMTGSLAKLHISERTASMLAFGIIFGGLINIPIARFHLDTEAPADSMAIFGLSGLAPRMRQMRHETVIALNVGGCIIPTALAAYELSVLPSPLLQAAVIVSALNTLVCYAAARVIPGVGIAIPGLLPPVVAALGALALAPQMAAPVAFIAGVAGPLIGADLFHLKDLKASPTGVASIGGAGTFDGIVLSGIIAAYLA
jgi:uncharacterized membrane protein